MDARAEAESVAEALVKSPLGGAVSVEGLGTFHVRDRRRYRRGIGVLFVLAPELRAALAGGGADHRAGLAADVAAAMREGRAFEAPALGTFRPVVTTPKNLIERDGRTRPMEPRPAVAFAPSGALLARLKRA